MALGVAAQQLTQNLAELLKPAELLLDKEAWLEMDDGVSGLFDALQRRAADVLDKLSETDAAAMKEGAPTPRRPHA